VIALFACSSGTTIAPGSPGTGLSVMIATAAPDSVGYRFTVNVTNTDTADVAVRACDSRLEALYGGQWTNRSPDGGPCQALAIILFPEQTMTFVLRDQPVASGDQVRLTLGWTAISPRRQGSSTSPTITVQ